MGAGRCQEHDDNSLWDATEAEALYDLLEDEVIPEFYSRDEHGVPSAWVARMRESMARLTPRYSSNCTVREYTEKYYLPAASACHERRAGEGVIGLQIDDWQHALEDEWAALRFREVKIDTDGRQHVFEVQVYLDDLDPLAVRVELYANGVGGHPPERVVMTRVRQLVGAINGYAYHAAVSACRAAEDYTARIIPHRDDVAVSLENSHIPHILWRE